MDKKITVSDAEWTVLEVLWSAGKPLNATDIRNGLGESRRWERTTVLTLIQRLLKKGVLRQEKREVYYYEPCVKREEYIKDETKDFVDKFFRGSSRNLAAALVNSEALSKKELEELRDYFNQNC
ncbi:BlaI/MecI/CopY family transcriptional regulator [bacterium 1xD8-48]|jgi:BlaI family penicillinase repressor|nr:BlaI/MecI/CopY family transcriptional regulator [Lachnospiraceae bacterium]MCI9325385.1 BlaI/MecI/CopY family transcriptional regulator [Lachnospiraceae bacterium]NBK00101.1 BlaI/MecI/CopY family transcriptional regulator [bacterium 1xD8-48]